jgi:glutaredoxin 3
MNETIIWSKDNCPYCVKAKAMLDSKGIRYEERNITTSQWTKQQLLESVPDAKTVPQIFLYGKYIGGADALAAYFDQHDMWRND